MSPQAIVDLLVDSIGSPAWRAAVAWRFEHSCDGLVTNNQLITRHVPLTSFQNAFDRRPEDIKVVIEFGAA